MGLCSSNNTPKSKPVDPRTKEKYGRLHQELSELTSDMPRFLDILDEIAGIRNLESFIPKQGEIHEIALAYHKYYWYYMFRDWLTDRYKCEDQTFKEFMGISEKYQNSYATAMIGVFYYEGLIIKPDIEKAIEFSEKAIEYNNGDICANIILVKIYGRQINTVPESICRMIRLPFVDKKWEDSKKMEHHLKILKDGGYDVSDLISPVFSGESKNGS